MSTLTDLTEPARERLDDARRLALSTGGQLRDRTDDLRDRTEELRDRLPELREDLDPVVRRARIGLWEAMRVLISSLLVIPRLLVRSLGVAAEAVTVLTGQRDRMAARAREAAHRVPEPARVVVRRRLRTGVLVGLAFALGALIGWLLARGRADDELRFDAPQPAVGLGTMANGVRQADPTDAATLDPAAAESIAAGDDAVTEGEQPAEDSEHDTSAG